MSNIRKARFLFLTLIFLPRIAPSAFSPTYTTLSAVPSLMEKEVRSQFPYSGLAVFYNEMRAYIVDESGIKLLEAPFQDLKPTQSLAIVGRYNILLIRQLKAQVSFENGQLNWNIMNSNSSIVQDKKIPVELFRKSELKQHQKSLYQIKYAHLLLPIRILCLGVEELLLKLHSVHRWGWGVSIILLSLFLKLLMLPIGILLIRSQRKMYHIQSRLAPELDSIKKRFSGELAHKKFMAAHKQEKVTPFYTLRPILLTLIPVPLWIAIFNVLGELDLIAGQSFLWVQDLSYPDAIFYLGFHIPFFGNTINLLPILMTSFTIFATSLLPSKNINKIDLKKQKRNLYFIALGFFVMLYPFPSSMVLYWTCANIWQVIQQKFVPI